ncbi:hypothetical protein AFLA_003613 [Aspergillus flavus NRRL3357]|nr:hypothetical protein AFLA_003613 [Aspergillus flavus NRRL3357]
MSFSQPLFLFYKLLTSLNQTVFFVSVLPSRPISEATSVSSLDSRYAVALLTLIPTRTAFAFYFTAPNPNFLSNSPTFNTR